VGLGEAAPALPEDELFVGGDELRSEGLRGLGERRDGSAEGASLLAGLGDIVCERVHRLAQAKASLACLMLDHLEPLLLIERAFAEAFELLEMPFDQLERLGVILRGCAAEGLPEHAVEEIAAPSPGFACAGAGCRDRGRAGVRLGRYGDVKALADV